MNEVLSFGSSPVHMSRGGGSGVGAKVNVEFIHASQYPQNSDENFLWLWSKTCLMFI